jgi:hypothetical protein
MWLRALLLAMYAWSPAVALDVIGDRADPRGQVVDLSCSAAFHS